MIRLQCAPNFLDFGGCRTRDGGRVRRGVLFRSDLAADPTPRDQALLDRLRIRTVVDLRTSSERRHTPSCWHEAEGVDVVHLDLNGDPRTGDSHFASLLREDPTDQGAARMMRKVYEHMPRAAAPGLAGLFDKLADASALPLVVHCAAGKDRTGFLCAVLLLSLGVPRETVMRDYMKTARRRHRERQESRIAATITAMIGATPTPSTMDMIMSVRRDFLASALAQILTEHETIEAYLRTAGGVSPEKLRAVRATLTEREPR
ncbi:tyrosine-protein phosphatase [Steroidobacter sp.]|uniref:tyrosine-protein phosphatase n=1 Tax=Steroidobacter sp. TaxID=1978227 RepID=UPI001A458D99|nr:tyrosine-protein phosphatase [Steroidobacter sp.]MBL8271567.1 tyrosine-protein phosphatase [Steroidobacter sp.]